MGPGRLGRTIWDGSRNQIWGEFLTSTLSSMAHEFNNSFFFLFCWERNTCDDFILKKEGFDPWSDGPSFVSHPAAWIAPLDWWVNFWRGEICGLVDERVKTIRWAHFHKNLCPNQMKRYPWPHPQVGPQRGVHWGFHAQHAQKWSLAVRSVHKVPKRVGLHVGPTLRWTQSSSAQVVGRMTKIYSHDHVRVERTERPYTLGCGTHLLPHLGFGP